MNREIRSFDYVNHRYAAVEAELKANAPGVLAAATRSANTRAGSVAAQLRVELAGLQVAAPVDVEVGTITAAEEGPPRGRTLRIPISWKAAAHPGLFPAMTAELSVYALTSTETQLEFRGRYTPPLGAIGSAVDAAVGHRIAEASVHQFITDVAQHLRTKLATAT